MMPSKNIDDTFCWSCGNKLGKLPWISCLLCNNKVHQKCVSTANNKCPQCQFIEIYGGDYEPNLIPYIIKTILCESEVIEL